MGLMRPYSAGGARQLLIYLDAIFRGRSRGTNDRRTTVAVMVQWNADEADDADERGGAALQGLTRGLSRRFSRCLSWISACRLPAHDSPPGPSRPIRARPRIPPCPCSMPRFGGRSKARTTPPVRAPLALAPQVLRLTFRNPARILQKLTCTLPPESAASVLRSAVHEFRVQGARRTLPIGATREVCPVAPSPPLAGAHAVFRARHGNGRC